MASTGWSKVYWGDILNDPGLKICSLAAQGLWTTRILPSCGLSENRGYFEVAGRPLTVDDLGSIVGSGPGKSRKTLDSLLNELETNGVFSRDDRGCIFNRRMVRDHAKYLKAQEDGAKGGNPALNPTLNLGDNQEVKPRAGKPKPKPKPIEPLEEALRASSRARARPFKKYLNGEQENEPWAGAGELEGDLWVAQHARKPDRDG
jgi:hypothetical protein